MKKIILILFILIGFLHSEDEFLTISVVRNDGILIPFIRYDNNEWYRILNKPDLFKLYEDYIQKWYLTTSDRNNFIIEPGKKINFDEDGNEMYGYLTNARELVKLMPIRFSQIIGLATNIKIPITPVGRYTASDDKKQKLDSMIINYLENTDQKTSSKLRNTKGFTGKLLDIQSIEYFSIDSKIYYYIEAGKNLGNENDCPYFFKSFFWIIENNDDLKIIYKGYTFDNCDYKLVSSIGLKAYGALKVDGKLYVIIINNTWDGQDYILMNSELKNIGK